MIVRPMIGDWEVPSIERIATLEGRRLARLPIPGLHGDLLQDLGTDSLRVELVGSLSGDTARDDLLDALRPSFLAGDPVSFVADITTATELEQVMIEALDVAEVNDAASGFRYRIVLRQYVEPPAPPAPFDDLGAGLDAELDALAGLGLDALDLPSLVGGLPDIANPEPAVRASLDGVKSAVAPVNGLLDGLRAAFG